LPTAIPFIRADLNFSYPRATSFLPDPSSSNFSPLSQFPFTGGITYLPDKGGMFAFGYFLHILSGDIPQGTPHTVLYTARFNSMAEAFRRNEWGLTVFA